MNEITADDLFKSLAYHYSLCESREVPVENVFTPHEITKTISLIGGFVGLTPDNENEKITITMNCPGGGDFAFKKEHRAIFNKHKRVLGALKKRAIPLAVLSEAFGHFGIKINSEDMDGNKKKQQ